MFITYQGPGQNIIPENALFNTPKHLEIRLFSFMLACFEVLPSDHFSKNLKLSRARKQLGLHFTEIKY
jgi:hypothetical protein